jgi:hypothetical protein
MAQELPKSLFPSDLSDFAQQCPCATQLMIERDRVMEQPRRPYEGPMAHAAKCAFAARRFVVIQSEVALQTRFKPDLQERYN